MGGGQWMVVLIVAIVMISRIVRMGMRHEERKMAAYSDPEAGRLKEEVRQLKERLAVLERIATDDTSALDRQIEALRDRPAAAERGRLEGGPRHDRAELRERPR